MRILLFYGKIDALNHFTDSAKKFLERIGCETYVCTLPPTEQESDRLYQFLNRHVHAVIMYDGIGMFYKEIYNELDIPVINILVDHPMTFWHCMAEPPHKYIQFSPDEDHVQYSKDFLGGGY